MCCILFKNNYILLFMFVNISVICGLLLKVFGKLDKMEKERCFVFYICLIIRFFLVI